MAKNIKICFITLHKKIELIVFLKNMKKEMKKNKMRFVDIFSGIGGFHQALDRLNCECVCASEIDKACISVYKQNFPATRIIGDIKKNLDLLPPFDILCGGFPCQPFSKAGKQQGFKDETRGNLFYVLMDIIKNHTECNFVILENVKNLADNDQNWSLIQKELKQLKFYVTDLPIILSPHQIGVPQIRERVYILGIKKSIRDKSKLPNGSIHLEDLEGVIQSHELCKDGDARKILESNVDNKYKISNKELSALKMWVEFKKGTHYEKIGVPIWVEYFGYKMSEESFKKFVDHKGQTIIKMPKWKQRFVQQNREFYKRHKKFIDAWIRKYDVLNLPLLYQKLEWNCGDEKDLKETIIQFRQSGIRIKRMNYFPALVAINNTPIIYDYEIKCFRRITPREAANLQSFNSDFDFTNDPMVYKQLGNAVNVEIIYRLAKKLFSFAKRSY